MIPLERPIIHAEENTEINSVPDCMRTSHGKTMGWLGGTLLVTFAMAGGTYLAIRNRDPVTALIGVGATLGSLKCVKDAAMAAFVADDPQP